MADSPTDTSIAQVQTSYNDVNNALEKLLSNVGDGESSTQLSTAIANETTRAEAAEAALQTAINGATQIPVWMPIPSPFPNGSIPSGYVAANGASFSTTQYPQLGAVFTSGVLPDLRGLFIRGLDTTGLLDNVTGGRTVLSTEEGSRITGEFSSSLCSFDGIQTNYPSRVAGMQALGWDFPTNQSEQFSTCYVGGIAQQGASLWGSGSAGNNEILGITRPKNMAWNYLFRAA